MKKRILHLITGLEVGGTETMLLKTLPHLQDSFDSRVCCIIGHGPMGKRLEDAGVPVIYLELKTVFDFGAILRFRLVIKEFQPNILVTYLIHADLFGRIFGRLFGIKKIICNQRGKLLQWEFLRFVDRMTRFLVTKYIVQTETAREELTKKLHLPKERFEIMPNAIDAEEFNFEMDRDKKRAKLSLKSDDIVIVCVSKLRRGKGHEYLLEAFEQLHRHSEQSEKPRVNRQLKLLVVGDGEQKEKLLKQVTNYKSKSNVLFLGNRSDIKEILKISDIFVLATEGEGMSNAIMEAMVSGLPVVTTDILENRELIKNRENGILVPPKDSNSIAQATTSLINDLEMRNALGDNAKSRIMELFNLPTVISQMRDFYSSL